MSSSVFDALERQHAEIGQVLEGLDPKAWAAPTRCEGWDVADVVLHLAQTDELVIAGCTGRPTETSDAFTAGVPGVKDVDDAAELAVVRERGSPTEELLARWRSAAAESRRLMRERPRDQQIPWVIGTLPAQTLATTRLSEAWIHAGDIAEAVGEEVPADDRLWHIARLAWRTLPYAFGRAGVALSGPVVLRLTSPAGETWAFDPDDTPATTVTGPALDWCLLAARRLPSSDAALRASGPDAETVLQLARTYA